MAVEMKSQLNPPPPPPPPPPPLPRSVTKEEIAEFWRRKKREEEDHLMAAIKAAARIRARNLTEEDYKLFLQSLDEEDLEKDKECKKDQDCKEIRVGIKHWWTKSKYAYLNAPPIESTEKTKRRISSYTPDSLRFYKTPPHQLSSFRVF